MLLSNLMAEKAWNIPLKSEAGKVGWLNRWSIGAKDVWVARASEPKENALIEILHETLPQFGLKKAPKLLIYRDDHPNAASAGRTKSLFFSTSIVDSMSREQLKSIMGHELMHHKKYLRDMAVNDSILAVEEGIEVEAGLHAYALTILYQYVTGWLRYLQEYRSDAAAVKAAGPKAAIEALEALEDHSQKFMEAEMQKLGKWGRRIVRGLDKIPSLIPPTHPPTAKRIERILKKAPESFREEYFASKAAAASQAQGV